MVQDVQRVYSIWEYMILSMLEMSLEKSLCGKPNIYNFKYLVNLLGNPVGPYLTQYFALLLVVKGWCLSLLKLY